MIAKAILDMFSLSPATTRSAAQSSGQPFQAFSDSLLAASKSFLQVRSTSDGGSKAGRRQRSASDDVATPTAAVAGTALDVSGAVLPSASQQPQGTNANVALLESSLGGSTATGGTSTDVAGLFAQNLTAVEFAGTGSSIAQARTNSTSIASPVGIQSRFTLAQMFLGKTATAQTTSMRPAVLSTSGVQAAGLAESQTSAAQTVVAQTSNAPAEIFQAVDVQSKFIPVQVPVTESATTQNASNTVASQPTWDATSAEIPESLTNNVQTSVALASIAQGSYVPAETIQAVGVQSNLTSVQTRIAGSANTQNASTSYVSQPVWNMTSAEISENQTSIAPVIAAQISDALTSISRADILQTTDVQSTSIPVQMIVATPATMQNTSNTVVSQPVWNMTSAEIPVSLTSNVQTSITPASITQGSNVPAETTQAVSVQSNFASVQTPLAGSATTQNTANDVASQPTWNVTVAEIPETQTVITKAIATPASNAQVSIAKTDISQPADIQSKYTPEQMPSVAPATPRNTSNDVAGQPARNVTVAEIPEIQKSVAPAIVAQLSIAQPNIAQAIITPITVLRPAAIQSEIIPTLAQAPVQPATAQSIVADEAIQPVWNASTTEPVVTKSSISHTKVAQTGVSRKTTVEPASVQSSVTAPSNDLSLGSSKLPVAPIEEMKVPIAASTESGNADQSASAKAVPEATVVQDNGNVQDSLPVAVLNTLSNAVQNAVVSDPIEPSPVPVLRAALVASAKGVAAPALKAESTVQADPQLSVSDQSTATTTISVPGGVVDQLAASPLSAGPFGVNQIGVSSRKPVIATKPQAVDSANDKDSGTEQTGLKKDAEPATEKGTKSSSQDAASSGDQSQGGNAAQTQATTPVAVNFTVHPAVVIAAAQNAAIISPNHASSTAADAIGVGVKTADNTAHVSSALPQTLPVINTAKLIQSMGQSEMRVGMRSNEFGNISISTSTTRDQVSAQISLEHGELAKTLAAHLPEMQTRLGGSQPMDVRIDMNGAATGQGTGAFGGTSHGTQDQSHGGRQQAGNMAASTSIIGAAEKQFSPVAVVMPTGYARLDIRV